mmetsp:Transcript_32091/g.87926  ORF Transcript_32091/g.87926 Transcript_32091/m.87926 type:complete len:252 (+) Transcript_32091:190-945(+)
MSTYAGCCHVAVPHSVARRPRTRCCDVPITATRRCVAPTRASSAILKVAAPTARPSSTPTLARLVRHLSRTNPFTCPRRRRKWRALVASDERQATGQARGLRHKLRRRAARSSLLLPTPHNTRDVNARVGRRLVVLELLQPPVGARRRQALRREEPGRRLRAGDDVGLAHKARVKPLRVHRVKQRDALRVGLPDGVHLLDGLPRRRHHAALGDDQQVRALLVRRHLHLLARQLTRLAPLVAERRRKVRVVD